MNPVGLTSFVPTAYVRDLDRSRRFYQALGFEEVSAGHSELSAWNYLRHGDHFLLLATSRPPLEIPPLPLLFYVFVDDLANATRAIEATGPAVEHLGRPPHALGGEAKVLDPDGNTILLGQAETSASSDETARSEPPDEPARHFSLLREAAALAQHQAGRDRTCELHNLNGEACQSPAEVKLADGWGDTAWACLVHAGDIMITAPGVFIASQDEAGLAPYLTRRRQP